jgi:hypothetical protein
VLKQSNFPFEFSLPNAAESTAVIDKNISSDTMVQQPPSQSASPDKSDMCTPESSQESDDEPYTPAYNRESQNSKPQSIEATTPYSGYSSPHLPIDFSLLTDDMSPAEIASTPSSKQSKSSSAKPQSAKEFCKKFSNGICPDDLDDEEEERVDSSSKFSSAAFTQYRDPSPFTLTIDAPFSNSEPLAPLFEENFEEFGSYAPMHEPTEDPNPLVVALSNHGNGLASMEEMRDKKYLSCNKVWERIQQHPKFEDLEDDEMDKLCNELKSKAKCSGHGPVVPEEEVDAVLVKLAE